MGYFFAKGSASATTYSAAVLADSPVGYWRLDETSGTTAADSSGNGYDGTYVNTPTLNQTSAITGNAAVLLARASSERVNLGTPAALNITGQITLECLYKPTTFPSSGQIHLLIGHGYNGTNTGYFLYLDGTSSKVIVGSFNGSSHFAEVAWAGWVAGAWRHLAAGYDGSNWKIFFDGVEAVSTARGTGAVASSAGSDIGAQDNNGTPANFADGVIDEVAIYNTWIGATRIAAHQALVV